MFQQEEWRPVVGFPDYQVSDQGRVLSNRRSQPRLLRLNAHAATGYPLLTLFRGPAGSAVEKKCWLHHLVAEAFVGPRPIGLEIRHLDGDKLNNRAGNLSYGTRSQNVLDRVLHGTHHLASKTHCKNGHPFDEVNTYVAPRDPKRGRHCRTCRRERNLRRYQLSKAFAESAA